MKKKSIYQNYFWTNKKIIISLLKDIPGHYSSFYLLEISNWNNKEPNIMYFLLSNETRHNLSKPKKLADVSNKTKQQQQQSINPRI